MIPLLPNFNSSFKFFHNSINSFHFSFFSLDFLKLYYHTCKIFASIIGCIFILFFNIEYLAKEVANMNKLKIPENHSGVSKTLRLPENIVEDVQNLANLKNLSFNKVVISLLEFSLNNLDEKDKEELEKLQK